MVYVIFFYEFVQFPIIPLWLSPCKIKEGLLLFDVNINPYFIAVIAVIIHH